MIVGSIVANSILKKAQEDNILITPLKLNYLVYLLYSNYLYRTGENLFNELFEKTYLGPIIPTVQFKFGSFKNNNINEYSKDALGNIKYVKGDIFDSILNYIWDTYKYMSDVEIFILINNGDFYSYKKIGEVLSDTDILEDEKNRNENRYVKKLLGN